MELLRATKEGGVEALKSFSKVPGAASAGAAGGAGKPKKKKGKDEIPCPFCNQMIAADDSDHASQCSGV